MSRTLLLADDSVTIQRVIELTFAHEDVRVMSVGDGRRAMQMLETERPDIVLARRRPAGDRRLRAGGAHPARRRG